MLELPNYITFVLKKNTAFTYNKRVSSGSSEKHVRQAIQELLGEPPSPQEIARRNPVIPDFFVSGPRKYPRRSLEHFRGPEMEKISFTKFLVSFACVGPPPGTWQ